MAFGHGRIEPCWAVGLPHPVRGTESVETAITPCPSRGKRTPSLRGPMPPTDTNAGCPIPHSPLLSSFRCMNPVSLRPTDFFRRRLTATLPWPPFSVPALRLVVCRGPLCMVHALAARKCPAMSGLSEAVLEPAELHRESDGTALQTASLGADYCYAGCDRAARQSDRTVNLLLSGRTCGNRIAPGLVSAWTPE